MEDTSIGTAPDGFKYGGTWARCGGCLPATLNSSYYSTSTSSAAVTLRFNGTQASLYGIKSKAGGISTVSLDGKTATKVDSYAPSPAAALLLTTPPLAPGSHTLVLTNTHTRNAKSSGYLLAVDRALITPASNAVLYGKAGTFGSLGGALPTGESLGTDAVTNWGFAPGESEFFAAQASTGEIVMGTNPQTDDEKYATGAGMEVGVLNLTLNTFRSITIPTSNGSVSATNPFYPVGGASVDGIVPVKVGSVPRIAFISSVPYNGWDVSRFGEYPSLGYLDVTSGTLDYDQKVSKSATQINALGGLSADACPLSVNLFGQQVASCRGLAELAVLPLSQKFVVSQYIQDVYNGNQQSGRIIVMNPDGSVAASYTYPSVPNPAGGYYTVNPREVDVDPTSTGALEYFSVVLDTVAAGAQSDSPIQEFSYDRVNKRIAPVSLPFLTGQSSPAGQPYRIETAKYDAFGNLWVTQALTGALTAGPIVVYVKRSGSRAPETACAVPAGWAGQGWASPCTPDRTVDASDTYGQTRSLTEDPTTHTMFAATLSGYLLRVKQAGSGSALVVTTLPAINLGLDQLVDRSSHYVGVRKGVVDSQNRALWIPVVQVANPADCPTWPSTSPCAPKPLDQWLYRFDLSALSS